MRNTILALIVAFAFAAGELHAAGPKADVGAGRVAWFDISTTSLPRSREFYGKLFDWEFSPIRGTNYAVEIVSGGKPIGTLRIAEGAISAFNGVAYIQVLDMVASCRKATELGGKVVEGFPFNLSDGAGAVGLVIDPSGHPIGMYSRTPLPAATSSAAPATEVRQALAPTGSLRVGLQLGSPHNVIRDSATGEMKGVGFDLGKELAGRLGVAFEPVLYPSVGALLEGGKSGAWDVAFVGFSPARAKEWDFTALHLQIEFGYLVPAGSSITEMADVDRAGVRVAVQEKSQPDVFISGALKNATIVRAPTLPATLDLLASGNADAIFSIKPSLFEASNRLPGSRVLDGRLGIDPHAMVMPKGRDAGAAYAREFIEQAKFGGSVKAAIERVGMRGAVVAPLQETK